jgi:transposase-like protein
VNPEPYTALDLEADFFRDEDRARAKIERLRWPNGPACIHCGALGRGRRIICRTPERARMGLYRCSACRRQFTATIGTILESSHVPLHKWLQAMHLLLDAQRPASVRQIEQVLNITYKSAWNLVQRIRNAERRARASRTPRESPTLAMAAPGSTPDLEPGRNPETKRKRSAAGSKSQHQRFKLTAAALNCGSSPSAFDERLLQILAAPPASGHRQVPGDVTGSPAARSRRSPKPRLPENVPDSSGID